MYEFDFGTPQGWQCPKCKHVYSPTTPMCWYCGNHKTYTTTTTTINSGDFYLEKNIYDKSIDWINKFLKEEE